MVSGLQQGAQFTELMMTTMTTAMMVTGKYSGPTILGTRLSTYMLIHLILMTTM